MTENAKHRFVVRQPDVAYRDTWLWIPKRAVAVDALRASLELPLDRGEVLRVWRDSPHHIGVPRGLIPEDEVRCHLVDVSPKFGCAPIRSRIQLDHLDPSKTTQHDAYRDLIAADGGILNLACGAGKTVIVLHAIAHWGAPALIIAHQEEILRQWRGEIDTFLDVEGGVGWIQSDPTGWDWKRPITLGMIRTLAKYRDAVTPEMKAHFSVVIWDECVAGGTLVGEAPVESIRPGDLVSGHDQRTRRLVDRRVLHTIQQKPEALVTVHIPGDHVTCTPNHPFLTPVGWVPAGSLTNLDMVLCYNHEQEDLPLRASYSREGDREILSELPGGAQSETSEEDLVSMWVVRSPYNHRRTGPFGAVQEDRSSLLLNAVPGPQSVRGPLEEDESYESPTGSSTVAADAREQPNEGSRGQSPTASCSSSNGLEATRSRRQRKTPTSTPTTSRQRTWVGDRSCCPYEHPSGVRSVNKLQDRYSRANFEDRHRSGRTVSQFPQVQSSRSEKGRVPAWVRVDRVEVHEQTSDGTFGGHCPEGVVYNLTVEETPTFTVGKSKIVVHNCHHLSAREFCKTADLFPGRRYGTTATVQRGDGSEVVFLWHLGPVIHSNLTQDLVPTVTFLMSPSQVDLQDREVQERVLDVGGNVHSRRLINYVACLDEELEFVAGHIREALTAGRKILALSLSKDQLGLLHDMFPESGLIRGDVKGSEVRRRALKEHQLCFGTTDLAKEALDDRKLDALFVLTEFVKEGMLQQAVGRIQRIMDGKKNPRVVVIRHRKVTKLERMAKRMQSYFLKQGFKVEVAR